MEWLWEVLKTVTVTYLIIGLFMGMICFWLSDPRCRRSGLHRTVRSLLMVLTWLPWFGYVVIAEFFSPGD